MGEEDPTDENINRVNNIGELVNEFEFISNPGLNNKSIPLGNISEGIYFLSFQQGARVSKFKFIVGP